jgi:esterase/lipase
MKIIAIHGAFSSPSSFNHLKSNLAHHEWTCLDYSTRSHGIEKIIREFENDLSSPCFIIGHSLGGIIAANLSVHSNVRGIITLASPINGVVMNPLMQWMLLKNNFVHEITPSSYAIRQTQNILNYQMKPAFHLVTTKGFNPFMAEENDGVITTRSQIHATNLNIEIPTNHHEILQHGDTVATIDHILKKYRK